MDGQLRVAPGEADRPARAGCAGGPCDARFRDRPLSRGIGGRVGLDALTCTSARESRTTNRPSSGHVAGPRVAHPIARLGTEIGCAGRNSVREPNALTSLFAPDALDATRPARFLNRASEVRILPGALAPTSGVPQVRHGHQEAGQVARHQRLRRPRRRRRHGRPRRGGRRRASMASGGSSKSATYTRSGHTTTDRRRTPEAQGERHRPPRDSDIAREERGPVGRGRPPVGNRRRRMPQSPTG